MNKSAIQSTPNTAVSMAPPNCPQKVIEFVEQWDREFASAKPSSVNIESLYTQTDFPWYGVNIECPHQEIVAEVRALSQDMISPHYGLESEGERGVYKSMGWKVLFVHGLGKHKFNRAPWYGYTDENSAPYDWTEIAESCPTTVSFLKKLPYKKLHRAWFAKLEPNGYILPHRGRNQGASHNHKMTFALNHPPHWGLLFEGFGATPWQPGKGFLLKVEDITHCAYNWSEEDRYHLITMGEPDWERFDKAIEK